MKLWIRSQNKSVLKEASILNYFYSDKKHCIDCNGYCVGYYDSKERCLEIIDEIQDALCGNVWKYKGKGFVDRVTIEPIIENVVAVINKEIIELPNQHTFVYEMPKE